MLPPVTEREHIMKSRQQAAVIFDMDGVILDSENLYVECWKQVGEEFGLRDVVEMSHLIIGVNDTRSEQVFREFYQGKVDFEPCRRRVSELFHARSEEGIPLKKGIHEILDFLKSRKVPVAVASSTRIETVKKELGDAGLGDAFAYVIGGDMIQKSKPAPDIFLAAAKLLETEPENCYVLEDSHNGIRAAAAAGMHPVMVPDLLEATQEMRSLAEVVCPSLLEAIEYLREKV